MHFIINAHDHSSSQEIIGNPLLQHLVALSRSRIILDVCLLQVFIHVHNGGQVSTTVTIVWSREDGRHVFVVSAGVALNEGKLTSIIN